MEILTTSMMNEGRDLLVEIVLKLPEQRRQKGPWRVGLADGAPVRPYRPRWWFAPAIPMISRSPRYARVLDVSLQIATLFDPFLRFRASQPLLRSVIVALAVGRHMNLR